jgi:hypothetical protein
MIAGQLKCWGNNSNGKIGNRSLINQPTPVIIDSAVTYSMVEAGWQSTCGITTAGVLKCWGANDKNQLNVPELKNPKAVSAGREHTCAIDDSGVKCWGLNDFGQANVPTLQNPREISLSSKNTCVLDDTGAKCWGSSVSGMPTLKNPRMVSPGNFHACALDDSGVRCWGLNTFGQSNSYDFSTMENANRIKKAVQIPSGSRLFFSRDILIAADKVAIPIGKKEKNLKQCLLIVEPHSTKDRIIKTGKECKITNVESNPDGTEVETLFQLEGLPASISCLSDYPITLTIGEVYDSLQSSGIVMDVLTIAAPDEL